MELRRGLIRALATLLLVQSLILPGSLAGQSPAPSVLKIIVNEMTPVALAFDASGNLWIASSDPFASHLHNIVEYNASSLRLDNPVVSKKITDGLIAPEGLAFDSSGNLWVANFGPCPSPCSSNILEYNSTSLSGSHPTVSGNIPISNSAIDFLDLAFDPSGNLWVAEGYTALEYNSTSLAGGGPSSSRAIQIGGDVMHLTFDSQGDLWVSVHGYKAGSVWEFAKASLVNSNPSPSLTLPSGIAGALKFDSTDDLWVGGFLPVGSNIVGAVGELTPMSLSMGQSATISKTITDGLSEPHGVNFDSLGNLWVADVGSDTILEFNTTSLSNTSSTVSSIVGHGPGLHGPQGVVFDLSGNLWVASRGKIQGFYSACLASSVVTPKTVGMPSSGPGSFALDPNGNLWVTGYGASNGVGIAEINSTSLASVNPTIGRSFVVTGGTAGSALTFDSVGDLWLAETGDQGGGIVEIDASSLAGTTPVQSKQIGFPFARNPAGLAFDSSGNLWASTYDPYFPNYPGHLPGNIVEFNRTSLASSQPTIGKTITDGIITPGSLVFDFSGNLWLTNSSFNILEFNASALSGSNPKVSGNLTMGVTSPSGLAFDGAGNLWLSNTREDNVVALGVAGLQSVATIGSLKIRVSGTSGLMSGAEVTLVSGPSGTNLPGPEKTNLDGSVTFSGLPQGTYSYKVFLTGFKIEQSTTNVTACLTQYSSAVLSREQLLPANYTFYYIATTIGASGGLLALVLVWRKRRLSPKQTVPGAGYSEPLPSTGGDSSPATDNSNPTIS